MSAQYVSKANVSFRLRQLDFEGHPAALADYSAFFVENGDRKSADLQRWRHLKNPAGQSFATIAMEENKGDKWAALYVTSPVQFDVVGKTILGTQSLDTLTGENYRGHGLFPRLAEEDYRFSATKGARFVYGFPNGSSAPGFFGKLGWTELAPVPFLMKPLRLSYFAKRLLRSTDRAPVQGLPDAPSYIALSAAGLGRSLPQGIREIWSFDERATRLWNSWAGDRLIGIRRDANYLNWRLFNHPEAQYCVLAHEDGYIAFSAVHKHGGTIGYIMEFLVSPQNSGLAKTLLKLAIKIQRRAGADAVLAWCLPHSANYRGYRGAGFWPLPEALRPIKLHFGVRAFDPALKDILLQRDCWYLSYLDSDTV